jgi:hypothetical protein
MEGWQAKAIDDGLQRLLFFFAGRPVQRIAQNPSRVRFAAQQARAPDGTRATHRGLSVPAKKKNS